MKKGEGLVPAQAKEGGFTPQAHIHPLPLLALKYNVQPKEFGIQSGNDMTTLFFISHGTRRLQRPEYYEMLEQRPLSPFIKQNQDHSSHKPEPVSAK